MQQSTAVPSSLDISQDVRLVFASGPEDLNRRLIEKIGQPPVVVGEFAPVAGEWIPYHVLRSEADNLALVRAAIANRRVTEAAMVLSPAVPFAKMRRLAKAIAPRVLTLYNEKLEPVSFASYAAGRAVASLNSPRARKWRRRLGNPGEAELPFRARLAQLKGNMRRRRMPPALDPVFPPLPPGITVVIPSRDGKDLLATLLPELLPQLAEGEIIVSDNGSADGTAEWLAESWPSVKIVTNTRPLSFARAVNAGIDLARFDHVLLLNNDMVVQPGFIDALRAPFSQIPDLFCSTAQICFPPGVRREETGKAVWRRERPLDFPVRCDDPIAGEDWTWVLYGSGGCSLFNAAKLKSLGRVSEIYEPAYVEDMDLGFQAWKRGWPSVFCAGALVEHRHRATTSRFYTPRQLDVFMEVNYLRFLINAIESPAVFRELWSNAIRRLQLMEAVDVLRKVPRVGPLPPRAAIGLSDREILALGAGDVAVFPGHAAQTNPVVLIATPYLPYPLSHGGAVRIYNLIRESAPVLLAFCDKLKPPPAELLDICKEVILVRRHGTHYKQDSPRPDTVEEFDSEPFRACLKRTIQRWKPAIVQLEFTWMAQYADACKPAKTILVEHDITFDLQEQLLAQTPGDWELSKQLGKWREFETQAWTQVDCVVTMSDRDAAAITGAKRTQCLPNGADTIRFAPVQTEPKARRLLFIGSFAHLPNRLALEFFIRQVWPALRADHTLHIIGGCHPERYPIDADLNQSGIELEGFVPDVRPAYARAEIVVVPLTASAGTNIKVLEALAMGRLVVSTPAGINGLDLKPGLDLMVANSAAEFVSAIRSAKRQDFERQARQTALRYDWSKIARAQSDLYQELTGERLSRADFHA